MTYRRDVLYGEIWEQPATEVAKRYSISSSALARICARMTIPTPPRGYWARRLHGAVETIPPLPGALEGAGDVTVVRYTRALDRQRIANSLGKGRAATRIPIVVGKKLERRHPLIAASCAATAYVNGLTWPAENSVDIAVSPQLLDRATRIMNTLLFAFDARGLPVEVANIVEKRVRTGTRTIPATRVLVDGEWIRFGICEHVRQHHPAPQKAPRKLKGEELKWWTYINRPRVQLIPSGVLVLEVKHDNLGVRGSWRDAKRTLETCLNSFVKQLFVIADALKQTRDASDQENVEWIADERAIRERQERDERAARELEALHGQLARWREAKDLGEFIRDLREHDDEGATATIALAEHRARQLDETSRCASRGSIEGPASITA